MKQFLLTVLACACSQIMIELFKQGFLRSYWAKNIVEELTRVFDRMSKHMRKQRS